ncbi:hypothetical protein J6590_034691 [Homalodisca vitripennis]|nr:hypothetical protein J6590_034691 [Homalodisca vitripennis]
MVFVETFSLSCIEADWKRQSLDNDKGIILEKVCFLANNNEGDKIAISPVRTALAKRCINKHFTGGVELLFYSQACREGKCKNSDFSPPNPKPDLKYLSSFEGEKQNVAERSGRAGAGVPAGREAARRVARQGAAVLSSGPLSGRRM